MPVLLIFSSLWGNDSVNFPLMSFTSLVVLFVFTYYYHVLCTIALVGDGVGSFLCGRSFSTWLKMRLCPFRRLYLVLYLCAIWVLNVLPAYGCSIGGLTYVPYGMMWGSICGGFLFVRLGFIVFLSCFSPSDMAQVL